MNPLFQGSARIIQAIITSGGRLVVMTEAIVILSEAKYQIRREAKQGEFALRSQTLVKVAQDAGRLADEIVPDRW